MIDDIPVARFWSKVDRRGPSECWPWIGSRGSNGYGRLMMKWGKYVTASRISLMLALRRTLSSAEYACHRCDNRICVNPAHLFVATHAENMKDAARKGRMYKWKWTGKRRGEGNPRAKTNEAAVHKIRALAAGGMTQARLAHEFGLSPTTINYIINRRSWCHV